MENGDLKTLLVASENRVDFCRSNFEFQSSFECSLWGWMGLDPMYGDFKTLLVASENTVDFCSSNFEFQSSF